MAVAAPSAGHGTVQLDFKGAFMGITVITDSASSLAPEDLERLGIKVVPIYVIEDGVSTPETAIDLPALHGRIAANTLGLTTSQSSPDEFSRAYVEAIGRGDDVVGVFISAKLSGTFQSAELGRRLALDQHPEARIVLVDSESNSMQEGFAVLAAAECAAGGGDLELCEAAARASIVRSRYLFAPKSLDHLARGGRISNAAALLGSVLKIAPVLTAAAGTTGIAAVVRSRAQALRKMAALMRADIERCGLRRVAVQAVADFEDARRFAHEVIAPIAMMPVPVTPVGAAVSIHVGPAIGLAYETIDPLR